MRNEHSYSRESNSWLAILIMALLLIVLSYACPIAKGGRAAELVSQPHRIRMRITAYTSSPGETDNTPHITASGARTRDGIVATNHLPFGTVITIPKLFGNKKFVVEDRMAKRFQNTLDIWMREKSVARRFGVKRADVHVLRLPAGHSKRRLFTRY